MGEPGAPSAEGSSSGADKPGGASHPVPSLDGWRRVSRRWVFADAALRAAGRPVCQELGPAAVAGAPGHPMGGGETTRCERRLPDRPLCVSTRHAVGREHDGAPLRGEVPRRGRVAGGPISQPRLNLGSTSAQRRLNVVQSSQVGLLRVSSLRVTLNKSQHLAFGHGSRPEPRALSPKLLGAFPLGPRSGRVGATRLRRLRERAQGAGAALYTADSCSRPFAPKAPHLADILRLSFTGWRRACCATPRPRSRPQRRRRWRRRCARAPRRWPRAPRRSQKGRRRS